MAGPVVEFTSVGVRRSDADLLQDVTWRVDEGDRWVVLGPNGAGKTTLLDLAGARVHPTTGSAELLGQAVGSVDVFELRPRIGLSSALVATRVPDEEVVKDVVLTAAYGMIGRWREDYEEVDLQRAEQLLAGFGVGYLASRAFGTLSEGERKRVLIARALMTDPELLLLDEPAAGLDLRGREDLVRGLARLAIDPTAPTTVLVTHHVEEIPPGFDHALLLREGQLIASGPIHEVLTSDNLSATFGLPLWVENNGDRWVARAFG